MCCRLPSFGRAGVASEGVSCCFLPLARVRCCFSSSRTALEVRSAVILPSRLASMRRACRSFSMSLVLPFSRGCDALLPFAFTSKVLLFLLPVRGVASFLAVLICSFSSRCVFCILYFCFFSTRRMALLIIFFLFCVASSFCSIYLNIFSIVLLSLHLSFCLSIPSNAER